MTDHSALIERLDGEPGDCPFCGRDPYHYVDNGVGMERVAVTCCDEGIAYFQHGDPVLTEQVALRREAAAALRDLTEWRDIATAPKDDVILLFGLLDPHPSDRDAHAQLDKPKRFTGYWDDIDDAWCPVGSTWTGPWIIPTHWLPLPSAPNQAKEAGE